MPLDLESIKRERVVNISREKVSAPLFRRGLRRYRQLSSVYPTHRVFAYFANRVAVRVRAFLKSRWMRLGALARTLKRRAWGIQSNMEDALVYCVRLSGGLGDALIIARMVRDLQAELSAHAKFDIVFHSPKAVQPFFEGITGFRRTLPDEEFSAVAYRYDVVLVANQFLTFFSGIPDRARIIRRFPAIVTMFDRVQEELKAIDVYVKVHPALDGAFADLAVTQGHKRHTYLHEMLGIPYRGDRLVLPTDRGLIARLGLQEGSYVTVHNGWDANFKMVTERPTKALPLDSWVKIVAEIKSMRPDLRIVQLGGKTGEDIPGVDVNLKNKLKFMESVSVLAGSCLHVDTESGLVHAAACLGVRSVVMFGPTNVDWFGYSQNINVAPKQCGNCWWASDSWMDICVMGHEPAICTSSSSISPVEVARRAVSALRDPPGEVCGRSGVELNAFTKTVDQ